MANWLEALLATSFILSIPHISISLYDGANDRVSHEVYDNK